jgi:hypothetical protein
MSIREEHYRRCMPSEAGAVDRFSDDARNGIIFFGEHASAVVPPTARDRGSVIETLLRLPRTKSVIHSEAHNIGGKFD